MKIKRVKSVQPQRLKDFNAWAKKWKISSKWSEDTPEKKDFIVRLQEARFEYAMQKQKENETK